MLFFFNRLVLRRKSVLFVSVSSSSSISFINFSRRYLHQSSNQFVKMASVQVINQIIKPASDKRDYRGLELPNGIKVLLISDPDTDKSAGALSVGVGAGCDPSELPGLAHFYEHMVFLGTEKYPEESSFDKFLSAHAGNSNASTYLDHTTYRFDVAPEHLSAALDRFSQFFIAPLFNVSATEREVNAVNSENDKNIPNDNRRALLVEKATVDQSHPYSKFTTGNLYSLWTRPKEESIDVRAALLNFHHTYYSSNIMAVAVLGKETVDELQSLSETLFGAITSKNIELPTWNVSPYPESVCQQRINIVPIKDLRKIDITFPAPDVTKYYKTGCIQYLTHLVGHEGPGSLFSYLKRKNWANSLTCWSENCFRGSANFNIELDLSIEGWENQNHITEHVFQYLKLLKTAGLQQWIWDEMARVNEIKFRFKEKRQPETYVFALSQKVHNCPNLEDILSAGYLFTEYRPELISEILNGFVPDRCRIITRAKANEEKSNLIEKWYNAKYWTEKIDPALIEQWKNCELNPELSLPPKNEFIPSLFDLKPRENTGIIPRILVNNEMTTGWFLQDNEFLLPRASIVVELFSPLPLVNPLQHALNYLLVELVVDDLTEFSYMTALAGIEYGIKGTDYGIELKFSGYDEKLSLLVEKILQKIANFECNPERLNILVEKYKRGLKNFEDEEPRIHASYFLTVLLREKAWTQQEILAQLDGATVENIVNYAAQFISNLKLNVLVFGNVTSEESASVIQRCQEIFTSKGTRALPAAQRTREIQLPSGSDFIFEREHLVHSNSCAVVYFQHGLQSIRHNVLLALLNQLSSESCYSTLRTQEQLGYIVGSFVKKFQSTQGFAILVQSIYHPDYLESRIDNFLQNQYNTLKELSEEEFKMYRTALAVRIAEKPKTIYGRSTLLWNEIAVEQYNFDRQNEDLKELELINKEELLQFFEELIGPSVEKSKARAGVHIISMTEDGAGKKMDVTYPNPVAPSLRKIQKIQNMDEWKPQQMLYERCQPSMSLPKPEPLVPSN